jgi:hypothetical protein
MITPFLPPLKQMNNNTACKKKLRWPTICLFHRHQFPLWILFFISYFDFCFCSVTLSYFLWPFNFSLKFSFNSSAHSFQITFEISFLLKYLNLKSRNRAHGVTCNKKTNISLRRRNKLVYELWMSQQWKKYCVKMLTFPLLCYCPRRQIYTVVSHLPCSKPRGFSGLEVACWPLVPKFAVSHPAEIVGFFGWK